MKFFLDHDVPQDLAYALRALGHEVTLLREVLPTTVVDDEVFAFAQRNDLTLLTCNRNDFLPFAGCVPHAGIIVVVRRRSRALERAALVHLLELIGGGEGIHWPDLDEDLSVESILASCRSGEGRPSFQRWLMARPVTV